MATNYKGWIIKHRFAQRLLWIGIHPDGTTKLFARSHGALLEKIKNFVENA